MRIISEARLREFWEAANGEERKLRERVMKGWRGVVRHAEWKTFADVRKTFNHTDLEGTCHIFDVGGNKYRIIAKVKYEKKVVYMRAVLTHAEYDEDRWKTDCKKRVG